MAVIGYIFSVTKKLGNCLKTDGQLLKFFDKYGVRFIAITDNFDSLTADLAKFRENFRIDELDRLVLVTFIDRILIYDDTVEIVFKYSNEMEKVAGIVQTANELLDQEVMEADAKIIDGNYVIELREVC